MRDVAVTQDSFNLDWAPHNAERGRGGQATFQLVEHHGMMGLMENYQHFWKYQGISWIRNSMDQSLSDAEAVWEVVDNSDEGAAQEGTAFGR